MRRLAPVLCVLVAGCGTSDERPTQGIRTQAPPPPVRTQPLAPARCPADAANCASATGRVVYVERVDPDGDGDAHLVLLGGNVTGRGLSVVDVRRELRPDPLPGVGDTVTAAGPVYPGSYGQRQIQASELRVRRR